MHQYRTLEVVVLALLDPHGDLAESTITLRRLMDQGAIVICNLSKGKLGESTSHLLGALLTTALAQAALSRADTPTAERRVFNLYADEFQSFATESFALSGLAWDLTGVAWSAFVPLGVCAIVLMGSRRAYAFRTRGVRALG